MDIRVDYTQLQQIKSRFETRRETLHRMVTGLENHIGDLRAGGWAGQGAQAFYREMDNVVLPQLRRLVAACEQAGACCQTIHDNFLQGEEEAATYVQFQSDDAITEMAAPTLADQFAGETQYVSLNPFDLQQGGGDDPALPEIPDTAAERSDAYEQWTDTLETLDPPYNDISFFTAAAVVTDLLGLGESGWRADLGRAFTNVVNENANRFLEEVGEELFASNQDVYSGLLNGDYLNADGELMSPLFDDMVVDTPVNFDVHMVYMEQGIVADMYAVERERVEALGGEPGVIDTPEERDIWNDYQDGINGAVGMARNPIVAGLGIPGDQSFLRWANHYIVDSSTEVTVYPGIALPNGIDTSFVDIDYDTLSFNEEQHRRALGIALVFQEHGYTQEQYNTYMEATWDNNVPPAVEDIVGPPDNADR